ncbi:MAG: HDIG domain-containing protein [Desulfomicrobiaceae bacterium]|nr:HDIG domain-containing protein [Desulfomicrobiaceae bacterium]
MTHGPAMLHHIPAAPCGRIPSDETCQAWWRTYDMLPHIERHSAQVAAIATEIATLAAAAGKTIAADLGAADAVRLVRAAALLHDLGKTYCIRHGGNHSQLGAAWVMECTGNPRLAQGVLHHVYWPGPLDPELHFLPLVVSYSDKRVRHEEIVSVDERFTDLLERYGHTPQSREHIHRTWAQARQLESTLSTYLGVPLHEHPFDCRRLVSGA